MRRKTMNMIRWNPFTEMDDLFKSYNRAMTRNPAQEGLLSTDWSPSVDITEDDKEFLIKAELPEIKKEDISVDVNQGVVTLSGERKSESRDEKEHRIERFYGRFSRSFTLPENVNEADIKAENKDGMLYLHLPKSVVEKPKKIKVDIH
jgi:HSP20 family protein